MACRKDGHKPIAITGATGFVGQRLLAALSSPEQPLRALRRGPVSQVDVAEPVEWVRGDLGDHAALKHLVSGAATVIHVAGATKATSRAKFFEINAAGTFNLMAAARQAGVRHVILVSSLAASQPGVSDYAASKAAGERAGDMFGDEMQVSVIRPPAVIGPGDPMLAPLLGLLRRGILPAPAEPAGRPRRFSVIGVDDLVRVIAQRIDEPLDHILAPCSVSVVTWSDIQDAAQEVLGKRVRRVPLPAPLLLAGGHGADVISGLLRRTMPVSAGKIRELLAHDWTCQSVVSNPSSLQQILASCLVETE